MNAADLAPERSQVPVRPRRLAVAILLIVGVGIAVYLWKDHEQVPRGAVPDGMHATVPASSAAVTPVPPAGASDLPLGDRELGATVASLFGLKQWPAFAYPDNILRRFVATVDALPRGDIPIPIRVIRPVPGPFRAAGMDDALRADAANAERYEVLVATLEQIAPSAAGDLYARLYPRLQQQYASLGYPDRSFHKRLLEALDDILAAPAVANDVALARPNVLFVYADPALERRSAGQKALMRLGAQREARAKAQIERIREEIARRPPLSQIM